MKVLIQRISQDDTQTLGELKILGCGEVQRFTCLELPWKDNRRNVSCVPEGRYRAIRYKHPERGSSIVVLNVPGRTDIMVHVANFHRQLQGCIAPGIGFRDIDRDGHVDVTESRIAMEMIYDVLPDKFILEIKNLF